MKRYALIRREGRDVVAAVHRAQRFLDRTIGLLGESYVAPRTGLWLDSCSAIHTLFMRSRIDVIFVDRDGRIRRMVPNVRPNLLAVASAGAYATIELGPGTIERAKIAVGDHLELEAIP